jgi:hypothetical protein
VGKFALPISLSYHSGGMKVEEVASSVGLGWSLTAGGVITRSMHGGPDEEGGYFAYHGLTVDSITHNTNITSDFCAGTLDDQPDIFYYNFAGQSGKFVLDTTAQHNPRFIPFANLKITHDPGLDSFRVVDANGIIYIFSTPETTSVEGGRPSPTYISSWYLTKIITPAGDINFTYLTDQTSQIQRYQLDYLAESTGQALQFKPSNVAAASTVVVDARVLTQITSPFETITFQTKVARQDMPSASSITGMKVIDPNGIKIKQFGFAQSYFGPTSATDPNALRLKLDRVDEMSVWDTTQVKSYAFDYYSPTSVPSLLSYAKDFWGFYNGQNGNITALPYLDPTQYPLFVANQANPYGILDPDSVSSKVGVLKTIQYPTGGTSTFIYEGNDYSSTGVGDTVQRKAKYTVNVGRLDPLPVGAPLADTFNFHIPYLQTVTMVAYGHNSNGTHHDGYAPEVVLNKINSNGTRTSIETSYLLNASYTYYPLLDTGNYELIATIDDGNLGEGAFSNLTFASNDTSALARILPTGGVRIKQIINTDSASGTRNIKNYSYRYPNLNNISSGSLVQPIQLTKEKLSYSAGFQYTLRGSSPANYLGSTQGGHIGYAVVTVSDSIANQGNGRKVSYFSSPWDVHDQSGVQYSIYDSSDVRQNLTTTQYKIENDVYRGYSQKELEYNTNGVLLHSTVNNYNITFPSHYPINYYEAAGIVGYEDYICNPVCTICNNTGSGASVWCGNNILYNYGLATYHVICPWIFKTSAITTAYDQNGLNPIIDTINYYYDDSTHGQVTRVLQTNSKGDSLKTVNIYANEKSQISGLDPAASVVLDSMVARNMIAPVIQEEHYNNNNLASRNRTDYAIWGGTRRNISPLKKWVQVGTNPIEARLNFISYDAQDNFIQVAQNGGINISFLWDYLGAYPVAEAKNADSASIACTSFESTGTGNWVISGGSLQTSGGFTGKNYYTLASGATISKTGLNTSRKYVVTYWSKNGALTISGTTPVSGLVKRGWTFYQHNLPASTSSVTISGSGISLDELRLYPIDALMTTYTYKPLVGTTSECSPANIVTYYEYDGFQRLLRVRDMDSNIIRQYNYAYQVAVGHPFYNVAKSGTFTRNNCSTGATGGSVVYTVAAHTYSSMISQSNADSLAQADVNANGQNYANANGTCTYYNVVKTGTYTRNNCSCQYTGSSVVYSVAAGTYSSTVSQAAADALAQNDVNANGQNYANTNGTCTTTCLGPSQKISGCSCLTGTLGVFSQTQSGSGSSTKCTIQYAYYFSDGTYLLGNRVVNNGPCQQQ